MYCRLIGDQSPGIGAARRGVRHVNLNFGLIVACLAVPTAAGAQGLARTTIDQRATAHPDPERELANRRSRDVAYRAWRGEHAARLNSYAYRPILRFAECVSRLDKAAAERVLGAPLQSLESANALVRAATVNRGCVVEHSMVHPLLLRAALAETSLKAGGGSALPGSGRPVGVPAIVDGYPLRLIADCQVRRAPNLVRELLATQPGDSSERRAAQALFSSTAECGATQLGRLAPTAARLALVESEYARRFDAGE